MLLSRALASTAPDQVVEPNTPIEPAVALADPWHLVGHSLVDLGEDVFTRGRPHPMTDHTIRNARLVEEAADPTTAVVLVDVVLGDGSHADPATAMAPAIEAAIAAARGSGRELPIIATVVGTPRDPQGLDSQVHRLRSLGVHLVIAGGGGGIPVVGENGALHGVDAVIDKDSTSPCSPPASTQTRC